MKHERVDFSFLDLAAPTTCRFGTQEPLPFDTNGYCYCGCIRTLLYSSSLPSLICRNVHDSNDVSIKFTYLQMTHCVILWFIKSKIIDVSACTVLKLILSFFNRSITDSWRYLFPTFEYLSVIGCSLSFGSRFWNIICDIATQEIFYRMFSKRSMMHRFGQVRTLGVHQMVT